MKMQWYLLSGRHSTCSLEMSKESKIQSTVKKCRRNSTNGAEQCNAMRSPVWPSRFPSRRKPVEKTLSEALPNAQSTCPKHPTNMRAFQHRTAKKALTPANTVKMRPRDAPTWPAAPLPPPLPPLLLPLLGFPPLLLGWCEFSGLVEVCPAALLQVRLAIPVVCSRVLQLLLMFLVL